MLGVGLEQVTRAVGELIEDELVLAARASESRWAQRGQVMTDEVLR
jgi:hypothetical protein